MSDLYNRIMSLCEEKGVSGYRMCKDIKMQPSILTDLKMGRQHGLSAKNADKLAAYFDVSVGYLLGTDTKKAPILSDGRGISDDDIKFALFGGAQDITDDMFEEVKDFAKYVQQREKNKNK